jgi:murein DD-endopeptidase MepM/ murein hydrolase activator NlpD
MKSWILLASILLAVMASAQTTHHHRKHRSSRLRPGSERSLLGRLLSVRSKKAELRVQLRKTSRAAHAVLGDIQAVDQRLSTVKDQLDDTTQHLGSSRVEQRHIGGELDAATTKVGQVKEQVRQRLRAIYVHGSGSVLTALVDSQSLGDVATRAYLMRTVARQDQALFAQYRGLRSEIADRKQRQDRLVANIDVLARRQESQTQELAQVRQDKGEILEGLRQKQSELRGMIEQFEADEREIGSQIAAFAARSRPARGRGHGLVQLPAFTGRFMRPVEGRISDGFGMRYHPILHQYRMHEGVDIAAPAGTPIHAAADGQVISTSYMRGYGNVVILDHGGGVSTVYAHASRIYCSTGQQVHRGDVIAAVGSTGLATGPHCHFEVRISGRAVNPMGHF